MEENDMNGDRFMAEAVILDAGAFPKNAQVVRWLDSGLPVVCCDGAADSYIASGRIPWRIIGDCDSLSSEIREKYADIVHRVPEQETNDQTKSVRYLVARGFRRIAILGATGLREDHTLGNISLLIEYLKHGIEARIYTDYGIFIPVHDEIVFDSPLATQVSIFNFGASDMTSEDLKYPIRDFHNLWEGTLNETVMPTVRIKGKGYFMIYIVYQRVCL